MEGGGFFPFGGDPEEILRGLRDFAEQQAEGVKEAQREQFATLTLSTAVELTQAALAQVSPSGTAAEQALQLRDAMRVLFPEAVALVSAARQGFMGTTVVQPGSGTSTSSPGSSSARNVEKSPPQAPVVTATSSGVQTRPLRPCTFSAISSRRLRRPTPGE